MKKLAVVLCLGLLLLGLVAPGQGAASDAPAWLGPFQVESLYTLDGSGDLYVKTNFRTLLIPAGNSQGQALVRAAWQAGKSFWCLESGDTISAVWVGEAPY